MAVVVIPSNDKGDRAVESLGARAPGGWQMPVRSVQGGEQLGRPQQKRTRKPRKRAPREADCGRLGAPSRSDLGEGPCRNRESGHIRFASSPGSERAACQDGMVVKARNHSRVASALPHSEGIAYKPLSGEIAVCP